MTLQALEAPPPHWHVADFMGQPMAERLLALAIARQADFETTVVGNDARGNKPAVDRTIRSSLALRDLGDLQAELEARFSAILDTAIRTLRLSPIALHRLELELVAHNDGDFYRKHIDTASGTADRASDRALTAIYYVHRQPRGFDGGELRLHAVMKGGDGVRRFVDIAPAFDSLLLFPSWAPHEVRPVSCPSGAFADSRFALSCWFRTRR